MRPFKTDAYAKDFARLHATGPFGCLLEHYPECAIVHTAEVSMAKRKQPRFGDSKYKWVVMVTGRWEYDRRKAESVSK